MPQETPLDALAIAAKTAARSGDFSTAKQLWSTILESDPRNFDALMSLGQESLLRGDPHAALSLYRRAEAVRPQDPNVPLQMSFVFRSLGNPEDELAAIDKALALDPAFPVAFLASGMALERQGKRQRAADAYKIALRLFGDTDALPPQFRDQLDQARRFLRRQSDEMSGYFDEHLRSVKQRHAGKPLSRIERCQEALTGRKKIYVQQPHMLHFPEVPAIQFYDRALFPWLPRLEAMANTIRDELVAVLNTDSSDFKPYIQYAPGAAATQWSDLNNSRKWSSYFLWRNGQAIEAHCSKCPRTAELLAELPLFDGATYGPTVMFSALQGKTTIRPHTGDTNIRLTGHLPLILPSGCRFRVGNEVREWREGEAWIFDDTIEHEAVNDNEELRVILIFDVWNPYIEAHEREILNELLPLYRKYNRADA